MERTNKSLYLVNLILFCMLFFGLSFLIPLNPYFPFTLFQNLVLQILIRFFLLGVCVLLLFLIGKLLFRHEKFINILITSLTFAFLITIGNASIINIYLHKFNIFFYLALINVVSILTFVVFLSIITFKNKDFALIDLISIKSYSILTFTTIILSTLIDIFLIFEWFFIKF